MNSIRLRPEAIAPGALDGTTIMRYAHIYRGRSGGGVERYLRLLNECLLSRHDLTIVQTYVTSLENVEVEIELSGRGRIVWIPISFREYDAKGCRLLSRFLHVISGTYGLSRLVGYGAVAAKMRSVRELSAFLGGHFCHRETILSRHLERILRTQQIDLVCLHWMSYDTSALVSAAKQSAIPYVVINHFSNERLSLKKYLRWLADASSIGGVSSRCVPLHARDKFINLSDAVDIEFFAPDRSGAQLEESLDVILPARIDRSKGHDDVLRAAEMLAANGTAIKIGFIGPIQSTQFLAELKRRCGSLPKTVQVKFLGEVNPTEMRNWYASSKIVVLPSRSEGLGRVLLEAQAMERPVIAYASGGVADALIPDRTGYLLAPGDVGSLANCIEVLLQDKARRHDMGKAGRAFVSLHFSTNKLIERHEEFYIQAMGRALHNS